MPSTAIDRIGDMGAIGEMQSEVGEINAELKRVKSTLHLALDKLRAGIPNT